ncbi:hypothetical protein FNH22_00595 [Fulvivirga sp. M361]|uniref:hypothetical protein n=1 Tax=Fulvivirga sp. M361 TaxID=2594266 RepID=UPI00117AA341|nr:hypothetical protein [Fulvivirga sp. M361]TRX62625.1 hypothetical protein FNH22_00595 [Fulvivirga sp. M361]
MKYSNPIFIGLLLVFSFNILNAQENTETSEAETSEQDTYHPFDFNLQVKNMHLWRGFRVTDAPMTGARVHYTSRNGKFDAGFWGGAGFNGDYTEIDYYVSYATNGFSIALWDINNYSNFPDAEIFDYDKSTTSHFVDLTIAYTFQQFPLKASWSTILLGRDTYVTESGGLENAYSNYIELSYNLLEKEHSTLNVSIAGTFSPRHDAHFYGSRTINNFAITYSKEVKLLKELSLPVSAMALWNADQKFASIQIAIDFF